MGFVSDILNAGNGSGFKAQGANIATPVSTQQTNLAYNQSQDALYQQQAFLNALQGQNGIGNQSNVFNQQQQLANQLQTQAQGGGPNPALAQLNMATGQNVANQAALMAGQRGAGGNVGLMGRQAAMQGASAQQQAAGQAAVLRANQQLAAQNALQQQQNMMGGLATQQVGQQANAQNALVQGYQNQQNSLLNAMGQQNNAMIQNQSNVNSANAEMAKGGQGLQGKILGGLTGGVGTVLGQVFKAEGGEIEAPSGPSSFFGKFLSGVQNGLGDAQTGFNSLGSNLGKIAYNAFNPLVQHSNMIQPGAADLGQQGIGMAANGGAIDFSSGGKLPGKAEVVGDSYANDKVPILGSPGEIMLPRSVTMHKNAPEKAAEFVRAIMAKKGMK